MANTEAAADLTAAVAREFRRRMKEEYVPRIARCVSLLSAEELWRRPGSTGNSAGNLLLHLEGNVRQWVLCGIGGEADARDRDGEFAASGDSEMRDADALIKALEATVNAAVDIVDKMTPADMLAERDYQGRYRETGVGAVLHVMEHFSGHAGQIYAWTKQVKEIDLRHYGDL